MKPSRELTNMLYEQVLKEDLQLYCNKQSNCYERGSYGYISDGVRVIYWQGDIDGILLTARCKPCHDYGTGYQLDKISELKGNTFDLRACLDQAQRPAAWLSHADPETYHPCTLAYILSKGDYERIL